MHYKGHLGLALAVMSLISIPFGFGPNYEIFLIIVFSVGLSSFPDVDLKWRIPHRKYTHNVLFAFMIGILLGVFFGYSSGLILGLIGFIGGFMGIMLHLLGDLMTKMPFKPLWPFNKKEIALKKFYSNSETANDAFFTLGVTMFFIYIVLSSGAFSSLI